MSRFEILTFIISNIAVYAIGFITAIKIQQDNLQLKVETLIEVLRNTDGYIEKIYLNGGCYQFYKFLKTVYPKAEPYISHDRQHVVTKIGSYFFDITGRVKGVYRTLTNEDIEMCEKWTFAGRNWLYKECPNCGEYVAGSH